jgi:hypothetical protein
MAVFWVVAPCFSKHLISVAIIELNDTGFTYFSFGPLSVVWDTTLREISNLVN